MTSIDTTQRDELALDIFLADNARQSEAEALVDWEAALSITAGTTYAHGIADGLIAKDYRKPRIITTVEELDALPFETVIRDAIGGVFERWNLAGWQKAGPSLGAHDPRLPASVLSEPEAEVTP
ncbi:hypothetical protein ABIB35_001518 [Arthrobacter sp. UYP6]|uniref:hypothetical protein n=1 Tax=Arthrobacter sp. UYP6 TaxID=1756378 RepID=UPI00339B51DD